MFDATTTAEYLALVLQFTTLWREENPNREEPTDWERSLQDTLRNAVPAKPEKWQDILQGRVDLRCLTTKKFLFLVQVGDQPTLVDIFSIQKIRERRGIFEFKNQWPIDLTKVQFSHHAIEQFAERFSSSITDGEPTAPVILAQSKETKCPPRLLVDRVLRRQETTRYFVNTRLGCEFRVKELDDETFIVKTVVPVRGTR